MLCTVKIRRDFVRPIRPNADQIDGKTYNFQIGWDMDEEGPYPAEVAMIARDPSYPEDAPLWIASGDLVAS
jgi:hypothetical protein